MFSREIEALLTLMALSVCAEKTAPSEDVAAFFKAADCLKDCMRIDPMINESNLQAWIDFNQLVLRDKMRLGPIGFKTWFDTLLADVTEYPDRAFVGELVKTIPLKDRRTRSRDSQATVPTTWTMKFAV